ncbi:MAG TPA: ABC transporter substrate-binding protein [Acidimicrobiia bacterium]|nr:ABC transporter substrate-binding protein [Acidimicrobiia bacterium]
MKSSKKLRHLGALLVVLALVATACGDDDATTTTSGPDGGAAAPFTATFGYVLPQTGGLASIADALIKPLEMANEEITAAGDTLTLIPTDSGTDAAIATTAVEGLLNQNVSAIIGPAATGVSLAVIDRITGASVPMCSPSNTGAIFTTYEDNGFYFRTAPPDNLQGKVHADMITADGATRVAVAYRSDEYGRGLAESIRDNLVANGVEVPEFIEFDKDGTSFDAEAAQIAAAGVDAVSFIPFAEGAAFLQALIEAGVGPDDVAVYTADGFVDNVKAADVDPDDPAVLEGVRATYPSVAPPSGEPTFPDRFAAFAPDAPLVFSAHAYDCIIIFALAAVAAGSTDPVAIQAQVNAVTRNGVNCNRYAECRDLLLAGENIDYDGASGTLDFVEAGEPGAGTYTLLTYNAEGDQDVDATVDVP